MTAASRPQLPLPVSLESLSSKLKALIAWGFLQESQVLVSDWGYEDPNGIRLSRHTFTVYEITILPFCIWPSRSPGVMASWSYLLSNIGNIAQHF